MLWRPPVAVPFHERLKPSLVFQAEIANRERKILEVDIDDVAAVRPRKAHLTRITLQSEHDTREVSRNGL